jgi:hypothetical protein
MIAIEHGPSSFDPEGDPPKAVEIQTSPEPNAAIDISLRMR